MTFQEGMYNVFIGGKLTCLLAICISTMEHFQVLFNTSKSGPQVTFIQ